jgi:hypothetical protein
LVSTTGNFTPGNLVWPSSLSSAGQFNGALGAKLQSTPTTITDTTVSGTQTLTYAEVLGGDTFASSNAVTLSNIYTLDLKLPVCGTNVTCGTLGSLRMEGYFSGNAGAGISGGTINLNSNSNNQVHIGDGTSNANVYVGGGSNTAIFGSELLMKNGATNTLDITNAGQLDFYDGGTANYSILDNAGTFAIQHAGTNALTVNSSGNTAIAGTLTANGSIALSPPVFISATTYSVYQDDVTIIFTPTATTAVTLPTASLSAGRILKMTNRAAFAINSDANNVVPLAGGTVSNVLLAATAGKFIELQSDGTNWDIIEGN